MCLERIRESGTTARDDNVNKKAISECINMAPLKLERVTGTGWERAGALGVCLLERIALRAYLFIFEKPFYGWARRNMITGQKECGTYSFEYNYKRKIPEVEEWRIGQEWWLTPISPEFWEVKAGRSLKIQTPRLDEQRVFSKKAQWWQVWNRAPPSSSLPSYAETQTLQWKLLPQSQNTTHYLPPTPPYTLSHSHPQTRRRLPVLTLNTASSSSGFSVCSFPMLFDHACTTTPANCVFFVEMEFHHVGQAGLEFLTSDDPPASASQSASIRITGMSHHAQLILYF
ncbi:Protein GVQW1 [Plecturocebus cupreus]